MREYEVPEPILNSPFEEPQYYWDLREDEPPRRAIGRRPAVYYYKPPTNGNGSEPDGVGIAIELKLVNLIRRRVSEWRRLALRGEGGVTRTTQELLNYWRREG